MRFDILLITVALVLTTAAASAQACRPGNVIGSERGSLGGNAVAPSRAVQNPCSRMYRFGATRSRVGRHGRYRLYR